MKSSSIFKRCFPCYILIGLLPFSLATLANMGEGMLDDQGTDMTEPSNDNFANCAAPFFGSGLPRPGSYARIGPNSKYFIAKDSSPIPIKDIGSFCNNVGLQVATIRHNSEFLTISLYLLESASPGLIVSIGATDEKDEGQFIDADGTPISFHAFGEGEPDNELGEEHCVAIIRHPEARFYVYDTVPCEQAATPICMFPKESRCYFSAPLSFTPTIQVLEPIGSTGARDYFVGSMQQTRALAEDECERAGLKLVDFNTGAIKNQILYGLVRKWIDGSLVFSSIPFWTGAKLVTKDGSPRFQFTGSGRDLEDLSSWLSLTWEENEPSDSTGSGLETCVTAVLKEAFQPSDEINNVFTLSTTNCHVPQYPICYKDLNIIINTDIEPKYLPVKSTAEHVVKANVTKTVENNGTKKEQQNHTDCPVTKEVIKLNLDTPTLSNEEIMKLSKISRSGVFSSDSSHIPLESPKPWLTDFINIIFKITKNSMPMHNRPLKSFLNIMQNMILIYYNSITNKVPNLQGKSLERLTKATQLLIKCEESLTPFPFSYSGGVPVQLLDITLSPRSESVDNENSSLDLVIESYWFTFLTAIGSCYSAAPLSKTRWLMNIYYVFSHEIISVFEKRWYTLGVPPADFGIVVGDMDINSVYYELKILAIAAFEKNDIGSLYFPRPLYITKDEIESINVRE